jgi:hypothetical protein
VEKAEMNSWDDYTWIFWAISFLAIEGIALFNSVPGDTLSEHVWAFLGVRSKNKKPGNFVSPTWTLRVARLGTVSGLVWLIIHLTTNWM